MQRSSTPILYRYLYKIIQLYPQIKILCIYFFSLNPTELYKFEPLPVKCQYFATNQFDKFIINIFLLKWEVHIICSNTYLF